jgi:tetratricopeptide (TPR) repeat protein
LANSFLLSQQNINFAKLCYEFCSDRGTAFAHSRQIRSALRDYNEAIRLNPNLPTAYVNRGNLYAHLGEKNKARDDFEKVLAFEPGIAETAYEQEIGANPSGKESAAVFLYLDRAWAQLGRNQPEAAIAELDRAIEIAPDDYAAYLLRGNIDTLPQKDYQHAIEDYSQVLQRQPNNPDAYFRRGLAKEKMRDEPGSLQDLKMAADLYTWQGQVEAAQKLQALIAYYQPVSTSRQQLGEEQGRD